MFVFTYVFPKIGQGVGGAGGSAEFTTTLVAGVVGLAIVFQGIQAVALPLVQEFGYSKEIEDRVLAPAADTRMVGVQKIVTGMVQGLIAAALVFPIAAIVPATPVHLKIHWLDPAHAGPAVGLGGRRPRAGARHPGGSPRTCRTSSPSSCCRSRSSAPSTTRGRRCRGRPLAADPGARSTRSCTCARGSAPRSRRACPTCRCGRSTGPDAVRRRAHVGRGRRLREAHDVLRRRRRLCEQIRAIVSLSLTQARLHAGPSTLIGRRGDGNRRPGGCRTNRDHPAGGSRCRETMPCMSCNFVAVDRDQLMLMPPSMAEWLPEEHLVWFVLEVVDEFDLSAFVARYRLDGRGGAAVSPGDDGVAARLRLRSR